MLVFTTSLATIQYPNTAHYINKRHLHKWIGKGGGKSFSTTAGKSYFHSYSCFICNSTTRNKRRKNYISKPTLIIQFSFLYLLSSKCFAAFFILSQFISFPEISSKRDCNLSHSLSSANHTYPMIAPFPSICIFLPNTNSRATFLFPIFPPIPPTFGVTIRLGIEKKRLLFP